MANPIAGALTRGESDGSHPVARRHGYAREEEEEEEEEEREREGRR